MTLNNNKPCCKLIEQCLNDIQVPLKYKPIFREYYMPLINNKGVMYTIYSCPWCGTKLPKDLRDEWFDILENEYKLEPTSDLDNVKGLPEEFRSDQWWKNRNL